ncbi:MAG: hypothetical protein Q9162_003811 [Coniocarpon cinnabarinum]
MICARCLRRATSLLSTTTSASQIATSRSARSLTSSALLRDSKTASPNAATQSTPQRERPAATSTSAAQPFSAKDTPSPSTVGTSSSPAASDPPPTPKSCVLAGTPLRGLNYMKNGSDPIALEDHEYPDWLWTLLDEPKSTEAAADTKDPRLFAKSARSRRAANKRARKAAMEKGEGEELQVPIYEQSVDLEGGEEERRELSRRMREKRRQGIKERNFLSSMR